MKKNYIAPATREVKMRNRPSLLEGTTGNPFAGFSIQRLNSRGLDEEGNKLKLGSELTNDDFWAR
jgi:hypothetical protein